jgi:hypothetical protein
LRLSSESVGLILQSVLGGSMDLYSVVELEQQLFKFIVLDRQVGLRVYALKSSACATFKVFFHLWNENGLARARISSTSDSGPRFECQAICHIFGSGTSGWVLDILCSFWTSKSIAGYRSVLVL